jgi:hypothetical protein
VLRFGQITVDALGQKSQVPLGMVWCVVVINYIFKQCEQIASLNELTVLIVTPDHGLLILPRGYDYIDNCIVCRPPNRSVKIP